MLSSLLDRLRLPKKKTGIPRFIKTHKVLIFPSVILVLLIFLVVLRINGSSVGIYYERLFGSQTDSALLFGKPRAIRSDEWGVNTPYTLSQTQEGLPNTNTTTGNGQDVSATFDVPYRDWSTLFKPQNWPFFFLSNEYAYALKWWLLSALVLLASYTVSLSLLPRKYLISSLLSIALFCSPFLHWWYQASDMLAVAYGLFVTALAIYILKSRIKRTRLILAMSLLTYLFTCFALLLYIPFILPIALVVGAFLVGHTINLYRGSPIDWKVMLRNIAKIAIPAFIAILSAILFVKSHSVVIDSLASSVYPGQRTEASGGFRVEQLLGGYFNLQLQDDTKAIHYDLNQSEASSFILLFPFLLPFFIYLWRKECRIDWRVLGLFTVFGVFVLRLFAPFSEPVFDALQLNRIPHNRLIIGLGVMNILLLVVAIQQLLKMKTELPSRLIWASTALAFLVTAFVGLRLRVLYDGYLESLPKILLISIVIALIVWILLRKYYSISLALLALLSFISTAGINPLYRGLGILRDSSLTQSIQSIGDKEGKWVVGDNAAFMEMLPNSAGVRTLSGVYAYPQLDVWRALGTSPDTKAVYNRYAHVFFSIEPVPLSRSPEQAYLDPPALDAFRVHADACSAFLREQNVHYVLVTTRLDSPCLTHVKNIPYPLLTFKIYKITN